MKDSEIKQKLKSVNIKGREQQRIILILKQHPPDGELNSISEILEYCSDYY